MTVFLFVLCVAEAQFVIYLWLSRRETGRLELIYRDRYCQAMHGWQTLIDELRKQAQLRLSEDEDDQPEVTH
jgi:hypothetical protein